MVIDWKYVYKRYFTDYQLQRVYSLDFFTFGLCNGWVETESYAIDTIC